MNNLVEILSNDYNGNFLHLLRKCKIKGNCSSNNLWCIWDIHYLNVCKNCHNFICCDCTFNRMEYCLNCYHIDINIVEQ